jgi:formate hydrogenlyase subunit 6/NADH:ubiquinone oxidoreductase subunit I
MRVRTTGRLPGAQTDMDAPISLSRRALFGLRAAPEHPRAPARPQIAAVGDACLTLAGVVCRSCGDACEANAIRFAPRLGAVARPELDATRCTGCGGCLSVCPNQAITLIATTEELQ